MRSTQVVADFMRDDQGSQATDIPADRCAGSPTADARATGYAEIADTGEIVTRFVDQSLSR